MNEGETLKKDNHSSFSKEDMMTVSVIFVLAMCLLGANILTKEPVTTKEASEKKTEKEHKKTKRIVSGTKTIRN